MQLKKQNKYGISSDLGGNAIKNKNAETISDKIIKTEIYFPQHKNSNNKVQMETH